MSIRLVVFDLDGTLIDSRRDLADAVNALIADNGGTPLSVEAVTAMVGEGASVLVRRALAAAALDPDTPDALQQFLAHYDTRLTVHTRPYVGIVEVLETLQNDGLTLAVLTNKPIRPTREILSRLELARFFSQVVGGDGPLGRKPDPSALLHIAASAKVALRSTVMVGDSPIDVQTARAAGAIVCVAAYGFGIPPQGLPTGPDELAVASPDQLPPALRSFRRDSGGVRPPETSRSRT